MSCRTSPSNPLHVRTWRPERNWTVEWSPFRLLMALQQANQRFGDVSQLADIVTAVPPAHAGVRTKLVQHPYQARFALYEVREDAAEQFSCVNRLDATQISPKAAASKSFGKYYGAVFRIGKKDGA